MNRPPLAPGAAGTACLAALMLAVAGCAERPAVTDAGTRRLVSLAPNVTDIIIQLGLAHELVGISTYCRAPGHEVVRVGGYLDPDIETIVALAPDLVMTPPNPRLEEAMSPFGREVHVVSAQWSTVKNTQKAIVGVAERLGAAERGADLVSHMQAELDEVARRAREKPPRTVLLVIARQPGGMVVAGSDTFLSELMTTAGARNAVATKRRYPMLSIETVVHLAPEVILDLSIREEDWTETAERQAREVWTPYPSLPAVRAGAVRVARPGALLQPGPHMGRSARRLQELIYENVGTRS